uniref:Uncharacterized protein n=1 Tax=Meloidogyne enterolobii TaxID=390850 RepID=A0A6V7XSC3_MELEN|nr:unnamed protein product [Meloidogyne enterolobii]
MHNISNTTQNITFEFLKIASTNLQDNALDPTVAYGIPLLLLLHFIILPMILICWILLLRVLRKLGFITSAEESNIAKNISEIPLESLCRSKTHFSFPIERVA